MGGIESDVCKIKTCHSNKTCFLESLKLTTMIRILRLEPSMSSLEGFIKFQTEGISKINLRIRILDFKANNNNRIKMMEKTKRLIKIRISNLKLLI
jgi:hypothetical protein